MMTASLMFHETNYPFLAVVLPVNNGMTVVGNLQGWHGKTRYAGIDHDFVAPLG